MSLLKIVISLGFTKELKNEGNGVNLVGLLDACICKKLCDVIRDVTL